MKKIKTPPAWYATLETARARLDLSPEALADALRVSIHALGRWRRRESVPRRAAFENVRALIERSGLPAPATCAEVEQDIDG